MIAVLRAGSHEGNALAGLGIDLDAVRRQADAVFGPDSLERAGRIPAGHIPFTPDAKKALQLALRETIRLKQKGIHTGHLMLGILRAESAGRALLQQSHVDTDALRKALEEQTRGCLRAVPPARPGPRPPAVVPGRICPGMCARLRPPASHRVPRQSARPALIEPYDIVALAEGEWATLRSAKFGPCWLYPERHRVPALHPAHSEVGPPRHWHRYVISACGQLCGELSGAKMWISARLRRPRGRPPAQSRLYASNGDACDGSPNLLSVCRVTSHAKALGRAQLLDHADVAALFQGDGEDNRIDAVLGNGVGNGVRVGIA